MKQFDSVPIKVPAKNVFNLSHDVKASYNFDKLYPFLVHPVYPGDTFNCRAEVFMRTMPLFAPVMHNVDLFVYFFFEPFRLDWNEQRKNDWRTFITGGEKGDFGDHGYKDNPSSDFVLPHWTYAKIAGWSADDRKKYAGHGSLADHMGFPSVDDSEVASMSTLKTTPICSLPFRAYQHIWNEYFRNQNVQNEIEYSYDSGLESSANMKQIMEFRKKCWEKDYFTSCLPFQQRGEAVQLPLASGDINFTGALTGNARLSNLVAPADAQLQNSGTLVINAWNSSQQRGTLAGSFPSTASLTSGDLAALTGQVTINGGTLRFSGAGIGTITDFRYCLRLQQWLENNARCGSRYIEQILAHFGVVSSDARLQRPELLGGGKIPLIFSDVPQTSSTDQESVQGNLAGKGMLYGKTGGFKKHFEEHGVLIGLLCIIPRTSYSQGIPRYWTAFDKTDWYFPEFAHLSEQAVLNKEVYFDPTQVVYSDPEDSPDGVFGYQGRFTELRYIPSSVHGELRDTLQYWHLGRLFPSQPKLNAAFVEAQTRADIFSIADISSGQDDPFVAQIHLDIKAVRPLPKFAVPTI